MNIENKENCGNAVKYGFYDNKRNIFFQFEDLNEYNQFLVLNSLF